MYNIILYYTGNRIQHGRSYIPYTTHIHIQNASHISMYSNWMRSEIYRNQSQYNTLYINAIII